MNESVKKVRAYPLPAELTIAGKKIPVEIRRLEILGLYIESTSLVVTAGTRGHISIALPKQYVRIEANVILVRSLDSFTGEGKNKGQVVRLLEFHFVSLSEEQKDQIDSFASSIGQK
tara:strand:- start:3259 stop:3609 length:351 start_codon:yes stop_codon:yes gene_type:complete